jgi:hypothetical protein
MASETQSEHQREWESETFSSFHVPSSVTELQAIWHRLRAPERAKAVFELHKAGNSYRSLAKALNCSDTLLRLLVKILSCDLEDLELAQQARISTREARRRAVAARTRREAAARDQARRDRIGQVTGGAEGILRWLARQDEARANAELILIGARRAMASLQDSRAYPIQASLLGRNHQHIVDGTRPVDGHLPQFSVSWYAVWLARWLLHVYMDPQIRWGALNWACNRLVSSSGSRGFETQTPTSTVNDGADPTALQTAA